MNRRTFLQSSAALAGASGSGMAAPSDRVRVGVIGCGGQGRNDLGDFHKNADVEIAAVCDVFRPNLNRAKDMTGGKAEAYTDFRRVLDRKDIDAVVVATPDHWHPLITINACDAGKDVYVEKPISHNVREGRLMVEAARRNKRVVQVGLQQRSGTHFQRAVKAVQEGGIGRVIFAQCWNHSAAGNGLGFPKDTEPPADLDWDMWLGPAPKVPYNPARRSFHFWWDYGGGQLTNWCVHLIDVVHWATGLDRPVTVTASGGNWHYKDCRECPDTQEVVWEYPDMLVRYSTLVHNSFGPNGDTGNKPFGSYGIMMQGTKGTLIIDRAGYQILPQLTSHTDPGAMGSLNAYDDLAGVGYYYTGGGISEQGTTSVQHFPHVRNFLDCVKSRKQPTVDIEIGHRTTSACLIGNIAWRVGQKLQWDAEAERFKNSTEANKLLTRRYRAPWNLPGLTG
jgi:predicted dehydrogenase